MSSRNNIPKEDASKERSKEWQRQTKQMYMDLYAKTAKEMDSSVPEVSCIVNFALRVITDKIHKVENVEIKVDYFGKFHKKPKANESSQSIHIARRMARNQSRISPDEDILDDYQP